MYEIFHDKIMFFLCHFVLMKNGYSVARKIVSFFFSLFFAKTDLQETRL